MVDVGTDNLALRRDPLYCGLDQPRLTGKAYYDVVDEVGGWRGKCALAGIAGYAACMWVCRSNNEVRLRVHAGVK